MALINLVGIPLFWLQSKKDEFIIMDANKTTVESNTKDDGILMSESCINWMTTQSVGGEHILVQKYSK